MGHAIVPLQRDWVVTSYPVHKDRERLPESNRTNDVCHYHYSILPMKISSFSFHWKEANIYSPSYCKNISLCAIPVQFYLIAEPIVLHPKEGNNEQIHLFLNIYALNSIRSDLHICQFVWYNDAPISTLPSIQLWSSTGGL